MPLIVGGRAVLEAQVGRIDGPVREGDLIVVGVVERLRERVRAAEAEPAAAALGAHEQRVVVRVHARLEIDDAIGSADDRVEDLADRAADDEVRAEIVHAVDAQDDVARERALEAEVPLLHARVLHAVVDDVDPRRPRAGQDEPRERIRDRGGERRKAAGRRVEEEDVPGAHFDRQRAPVQPALERLDLQRDAVVVDAVAAAHARPAVAGRPVEPDPRAEVVPIARARALQERLHDRVDLVDAADVLDVGVDLVPEPEVQRQRRAARASRPGRRPRRDRCRHRAAPASWSGLPLRSVTSKSRSSSSTRPSPLRSKDGEVLDELDPALAEHAEVEQRVHALPLAAGAKAVSAAHQVDRVRDLQPRLRRALRDAERRAVLDARERQLRPGRDRRDRVVERAERDGRGVQQRSG